MTYEIEYLKSKTGIDIANVDGFFIHSKYDPIKEASAFVEKVYEPNKHLLLFGHGLGYIFQQLKGKLSKESRLIVIDPIFIKKSEIHNNIIFVANKDCNSDFLQKYVGFLEDVKVICSPNYDKICSEEYKKVLEEIKNFLYIRKVSIETTKQQALQWNCNYLRNLEYVISDQSLIKFKEACNYPVVIASGGPSLTKQLQLLKDNVNKCLLIASGSTVNSLLAADIIPDIVVSIDGTDSNFDHFKELTLENSIFVYQMQSLYKIRKHLKTQGVYFLSTTTKNLKTHMENIFSEEAVVLQGGGSVANFSLSLARYISTGPITLIGQDLAFTDNKTHAQNNKREEQLSNDQLKKKNVVYEKGYYGDKVLTDYVFLSMKKSFESIISNISLPNSIFNSTEGGIFIDGFQQISFAEYVQKYLTNDLNKSVLNKLIYKEKELECLQKNQLLKQLIDEIEKYKILEVLLKDNLRLLKLNKFKDRFESHILQKIDKNDSEIQKIVGQTSVQISMDIVNLQVLTKFKEKPNENYYESFRRIYDMNQFMYNTTLELVGIISNYTNEVVNELNNG